MSVSAQPASAAATSRGRALLLAYAAALAVIGAAAVGAAVLDRPVTDFTREPQSVGGIPWYAGFVSMAAVLGWWTAAVACAAGGVLARAARAPLLVTGGALAFLALDDAFQVHEVVLPEVVGVPQPLVVGGYAVLLGVWAYVFRDFLRAHGPGLLVLGAALLAVSAAVDQLGDLRGQSRPLLEDGAKLLGIATWVVYFGRAAAAELGGDGRGGVTAER